MRIKKGNTYPTLRSLKKGTRFFVYGPNDERQIATAKDKRGVSREYTVEGTRDTYFMRSDTTVQVVK